ncbi:hypothetical protein PsYK624_066930 [Phanerochaete sordida]|uniref:Uncharacterized protein n=1 Tax=Phanerochaete sordida TaxID=48140 RepID=A0A9P3LCJ0_9APHY|nr:hypothetical protein PsYK624_066930 [Phanerochaete sordida]
MPPQPDEPRPTRTVWRLEYNSENQDIIKTALLSNAALLAFMAVVPPSWNHVIVAGYAAVILLGTSYSVVQKEIRVGRPKTE